MQQIKLSDIQVNPNQPRKYFDEQALTELSQSIKAEGVMSPIMVRPIGDKFEIVQGERRFRAAQQAGLSEIPSIVREVDEIEAFHLAFIENIQREQMTPIEEARAFLWYASQGFTQEEIAEKIKKTRDYVASKIRLLELSESVQQMLTVGKIKDGHAKQLLRLKAITKRLCTENYVPFSFELSMFEMFQDKFIRHFSLIDKISVKDVEGWVDNWYYLLVFSTVRYAQGYDNALICNVSHESKLPSPLTVGDVCHLYGLHINNLEEKDYDFIVSYEENLLKHSYDRSFRKWNIERFYDSIRFGENPLSNTALVWENPLANRILSVVLSAERGERNEQGFLNLIEPCDVDWSEVANRFKCDSDFRESVAVLIYMLRVDHSSLEIEAESIKEFYHADEFIIRNGFKSVQEFLDLPLPKTHQNLDRLRLMIEQIKLVNMEQGRPELTKHEISEMIFILFREDTRQEVPFSYIEEQVSAALALDMSEEEITQRLVEVG